MIGRVHSGIIQTPGRGGKMAMIQSRTLAVVSISMTPIGTTGPLRN